MVRVEARAPKKLLMVEGAVGAGKSTVLRAIEARQLPGVCVIQEPVSSWQTIRYRGTNILDAMYAGTLDPALFQLTIMNSRFGPLISALANPDVDVVVSERGPWSERFVFAEPNLEPHDLVLYEFAHRGLLQLFSAVGKVQVGFVYLSIGPEDALARVQKRGRAEEAGMDVDYMRKLDSAHTAMLDKLTTGAQLGDLSLFCDNVMVRTIDATQ